jgi:hypothetical protein
LYSLSVIQVLGVGFLYYTKVCNKKLQEKWIFFG